MTWNILILNLRIRKTVSLHTTNESIQECIPVGCIPSNAVAVCWGEGVCLPRGWCGVWGSAGGKGCPPGGCLSSVVSAGGCLTRGCLPSGGVCLGGICPGGLSARHQPVDKMTDRCNNITLPQPYISEYSGQIMYESLLHQEL